MKRKLILALGALVLMSAALTAACIQGNADPTLPDNRTKGTFFHPGTIGSDQQQAK